MFRALMDRGYDFDFRSHANALLQVDFPVAEQEISEILEGFTINVSEIVAGGGGEASITQRLRRAFEGKDWKKRNFQVTKTIDGVVTESTTHEIDHVKAFDTGTIALEIEWNNKDPFYDRDLENFKRLHADNAISMGIIITRGASLQAALPDLVLEYGRNHNLDSFDTLDAHGIELTRRKKKNIEDSSTGRGKPFVEAWAKSHVTDKFGQATTHWQKLEDRLARGVGNPCPFIGIGLPLGIIET